jgi:hypothetical protein
MGIGFLLLGNTYAIPLKTLFCQDVLALQHYEQFDSRHKGLIPLKRVYIPDEQGDA